MHGLRWKSSVFGNAIYLNRSRRLGAEAGGNRLRDDDGNPAGVVGVEM